jgi:hypothetical protein
MKNILTTLLIYRIVQPQAHKGLVRDQTIRLQGTPYFKLMYASTLNKTRRVTISALSLCGLNEGHHGASTSMRVYCRYLKSRQQTALVLQAVIISLGSTRCWNPFSLHSISVFIDRSNMLVRSFTNLYWSIVLDDYNVLMLQEDS